MNTRHCQNASCQPAARTKRAIADVTPGGHLLEFVFVALSDISHPGFILTPSGVEVA